MATHKQKFRETLPTVNPEHWSVRVRSMPVGLGFDQELMLPPPGKLVTEYLREFGVPDGTYTIELVPIVGPEDDPKTIKKRMARLRKSHVLRSIVKLGNYSNSFGLARSLAQTKRLGLTHEHQSEEVMTQPPQINGAAPSPPPQSNPTDDALRDTQRAAQLANAEQLRIRAELNLAKAKREQELEARRLESGMGSLDWNQVLIAELRSMREAMTQRPAPPSNLGPVLAALVPLATALIQGMFASGQRSQELLITLFGSKGEGNALGDTLPVIRQVIELSREFGGGEGDSPIGMVAAFLSALNQNQAATPATGQPRQAAPAVFEGSQPRLSEQDMTRLQVWKWLAKVQEYAAIEIDQEAAVEDLEPKLLRLPRPFRELVLSSSLESLIPALAKWLPHAVHEQLTGAVQGSEAVKVWLRGFLEILQDQGEDEEDVEDEDEDGDDEEDTEVQRVDAILDDAPTVHLGVARMTAREE